MTDVTRILNRIENGDPAASEQLLPLVYDELRKLAARRLSNEKPGQTLQATALVHEAYLRLVGNSKDPNWDNRGHFFSAAAEAMRRILVENARRKGRDKRGGDWERVDLEDLDVFTSVTSEQILSIDEVLQDLGDDDPLAAKLVQLRYFGGLSLDQAARAIGVSSSTAYRHWAYARVYLKSNLSQSSN